MTGSPMVSVIVPTKNEEDNLLRLLHSLEKIKDHVEVIVVDCFSKDNTVEIAERKKWVKVFQDRGSPGRARNIGIQNSTYDIIAMLDADTEITCGWYNAVVKSIKNNYIVAGYSPDPLNRGMPRVPVYVDGQDITFPQCNIVYDRFVFNKVGKLREDMSCAEDCEFHYRCVCNGFIIFYDPYMKVYHYERNTRWGWVRKQVKNGYGRYELNCIHPELKHFHQHGLKLKNILRLFFGIVGYVKACIGFKGGDK